MIMVVGIWTCVLIITLIIQATILPFVAVKNVQPDLLFLIVVSSGIIAGKEYGLGVGFFFGLLQDLASGNIFGINILSKMIIGFAAGMTKHKVFQENPLLPVAAAMTATLVGNLIVVILFMFFGYKTNLMETMVYRVLPLLAYNVLLSIPVHRLTGRIIQLTNR